MAHQTAFGNSASTDGWSAVGSAVSVDGSNRLEVDVPASSLYTGTNYTSASLLAGHTYEVSFDIDRSKVGTNDLAALVLDNPSSGVYIDKTGLLSRHSYRY